MARRRVPATRSARWLVPLALLLLAPALARAGEASLVRGARVEKAGRVVLSLARPLARADAANFRLTAAAAPDVPIPVREVHAVPAGTGERVTLVTGQALDPEGHYRLELADPPLERTIKPSPWTLLFTVVLSSALINNFVFTRYLGLCIFFGVSRKRETSIGMGATFAFVMVTTGMASWLLFELVLKPLQLRFLQVLVFIGVVAFVVQMLDTVLKKTHRGLHEKFGIYLVLITTNCIILAVPLLNAAADSGPLESFALALGSGAGFALALFLMSCARERVDLARVPPAFQGLPIAFALAGLFALAFMGFSGLSLFR